MTIGWMVSIGITVSVLAIVVAVLAILLDKGSYARSYRRWGRGR